MNALITGYTGYLGRVLTKFLKDKGWYLIGLNTKFPSLIERPADIFNYFEDPHNIELDYIFHLACHTKAGDWCLTHKGEQFEINQKINTNILEFWKRYHPQAKMIALGTSCSYDPTLLLTEDNYLKGYPEEGLSTYAFTKRMLLVGLKSFSEQYNLKYNYLIPSTIYGPPFSENDSHFIFDLIKKLYAGKFENKEVVLWGDGSQRRELIYIDDVVKNIYNSLHLDNQIMNLGYGKEYPIREYAKLISNYLLFDYKKIIFDTSKYTGVKSKLLDIAHTEQLIPDYRMNLTGLSDGLIKTINYYKELKNVRT